MRKYLNYVQIAPSHERVSMELATDLDVGVGDKMVVDSPIRSNADDSVSRIGYVHIISIYKILKIRS